MDLIGVDFGALSDQWSRLQGESPYKKIIEEIEAKEGECELLKPSDFNLKALEKKSLIESETFKSEEHDAFENAYFIRAGFGSQLQQPARLYQKQPRGESLSIHEERILQTQNNYWSSDKRVVEIGEKIERIRLDKNSKKITKPELNPSC